MAVCDVCSAEMSLEKGVAFSAERLQAVVSRGFGPPERIIARAQAAGLAAEQVVQRWKRGLLGREKSTWLLCPECARRAAEHEPPPATTRPAGQLNRQAQGPLSTARPLAPAPPARRSSSPSETSSWVTGGWSAGPPPALPARRRPQTGTVVLIVAVILAVAGLAAWYLPPLLEEARRNAERSLPTTPMATRPTAIPTATPVPDLSGARLRLEDLPPGFAQLTDQEMAEYGLREQDIMAGWADSVSEAQVLNVTSFWLLYAGKVEIVASYLLYPLTPLEQGFLDREITSGKLSEELSAGVGDTDTNPPGIISEMGQFGDASVGLTFADRNPESQVPVRVSVALVRHGPVLEAVAIYYADGTLPTISLYMVTLQLDKRVAAGLGE